MTRHCTRYQLFVADVCRRLEGEGQVAGGLKPVVEVFLQAPVDDPARGKRNRAVDLRDILRFLFQYRADDVGRALSLIWLLPGEHLVEHDPEREDIGEMIHGVPADLLRRHVGEGSHHHPGLTVAKGRRRRLRVMGERHGFLLREPEIENLDQPFPGQKDILRFEVPVHDAPVVGRNQPPHDLSCDLDCLPGGQIGPLHPRPQALTLQQLHHHIGDARVAPNVMDREDVWVRKSSDALGLALEPCQGLGILGQPLAEHLDRHIALEAGVRGTVHLTHSARAEELADRVRTEESAFF